MTFPQELLTGDLAIDTAHRNILAETQALLDGKVLDASIDALRDHFTEHFHSEEAFAERIGYPDREEHRRAHLAFFDTFINLRAKWRKTESPEEARAFVDAILLWVKEHVLKDDITLAQWARANPKESR